MTLDACYDALGLIGPANRRDIQRAYKRLVLKYHPDRCGDDPVAGVRFRRATEAYAILKLLGERQAFDSNTGPCHRCSQIGMLLKGLHGKQYCAACLLGQRTRLLPLPVYTTIHCVVAIGLQVAAIVSLTRAIQTDQQRPALVAIACGIASVAALALAFRRADVIER